MRPTGLFIKLVILAVFACHVEAWRGDTDAFDGPIGEYVRTLKKSYKEDGTLSRGGDVVKRENERKLKSSKASKSGKTGKSSKAAPAQDPTVFRSVVCKFRDSVTNCSLAISKSKWFDLLIWPSCCV